MKKLYTKSILALVLIFSFSCEDLNEDINSNPKQGTIVIPGATQRDKAKIRIKLLEFERELGGMV